ncbi:MAG: hypothetical protein EBR62_09085 [Verrucomicrobia bacterium]|nr:hypothetical protein [Verrucomicrobiota bacterium]
MGHHRRHRLPFLARSQARGARPSLRGMPRRSRPPRLRRRPPGRTPRRRRPPRSGRRPPPRQQARRSRQGL